MRFCKVLWFFCNFLEDRQTDLGIKAHSRSLKSPKLRLGLYFFQPPYPIWKFFPNFYVMKSVRKPLKVSCCSDSFLWMYMQTCIAYAPGYFNKNFQWYIKKMTNVWFIKYLFSKKNLEKKVEKRRHLVSVFILTILRLSPVLMRIDTLRKARLH